MTASVGSAVEASDLSASRVPISFMIPTKNEETNLPHALASICSWAAEIFVLDSGSTDRTQEVAARFGATVVCHEWEGYARQKNWGLVQLPMTQPWVFILDADEVVTDELRAELTGIALSKNQQNAGYFVNRYFIFLGKRIRHCGYYPSWNLRFFRRGKARYEQRDVHEHMIVDGNVGYLRAEMEHYDRRGMELYVAKHNHYSTLEARELFNIEQRLHGGTMRFSFWGGPIERRRWIKHHVWPRMPVKWLVRFVYMYFLRLGVLDGVTGFHFCLFLASYEHQIGLKLAELRNQAMRPEAAPPIGQEVL